MDEFGLSCFCEGEMCCLGIGNGELLFVVMG